MAGRHPPGARLGEEAYALNVGQYCCGGPHSFPYFCRAWNTSGRRGDSEKNPAIATDDTFSEWGG